MVSLRLKSLKPLVTNTPFFRQEMLSLMRGLRRQKAAKRQMCSNPTVPGEEGGVWRSRNVKRIRQFV